MLDCLCKMWCSPIMAVDNNQRAHSIVQFATQEKNPAAVALGRLGGLRGGKARAEKLSPAKRKKIAKKAALARWKKSVFILPDSSSVRTMAVIIQEEKN